MTRLIDADALIKEWYKINDITDEDIGARFVGYHEITRLINNAPTVFDIVLCKDCRYWQDNNGGYPHDECRWGNEETPYADDFCSYGERKEE